MQFEVITPKAQPIVTQGSPGVKFLCIILGSHGVSSQQVSSISDYYISGFPILKVHCHFSLELAKNTGRCYWRVWFTRFFFRRWGPVSYAPKKVYRAHN